jgi:hypothetical protein
MASMAPVQGTDGGGAEKREAPTHTSAWASLLRHLAGGLALGMVPGVFLFVTLQLTRVSGPTWLASNFENNYPYLFNSLLLIKGQPVYWVDHPGTTTQLFGAAVLRVSEHGSGDRIVSAVINDPDKFIKRIHRALLIFSVASLWLFPWLTALRIQSYITALLLQAPSLFFVTLLRYAIWFGSDLMLVPFCIAGLCLSVMLMHQRRDSRQGPLLPVLAGIVCALGILTKLTFFPIALIVFASCRGLRNRLLVAGSCLLAAAVAGIPIYPRLGWLVYWIVKIASHTKRYGAGELGFTQPDILWHGASMLISNEPMILWVPLLATIAAFALQFVGGRRTRALGYYPLAGSILMLFALQFLGFVLVAKHPLPHYLIPLYLSIGLNLVALYEAIHSSKMFSVRALFGTVALLGLLVWPLYDSSRNTANYCSFYKDWCRQQVSMYRRVKSLTKDDLRIDYYRSSSPEFAAFFGNLYVNYTFSPLLRKLYPNAMFAIHLDSDLVFFTFGAMLAPASGVQGHQQFYLFGNHDDSRFDKDHLPQFSDMGPTNMEEIDRGGGVYLDKYTRSDAAAK